MKKILYLAMTLLLMSSAIQYGLSQDSKSGGMLKVNVHYTGSVTVDDKHPIHVFLFGSADFVHGGAIPLAMQATTSKNGTVTFSDTYKSTVYASAVYDPAGNYDGQSGPPPSGSSLGLYSKTPGEPAPITVAPGSSAAIDIKFDDRVKM